ncbi:MAG TPA: TadE family protein [Erythrobacter sp.]|nr:TadE family protein [Erythrobacter sp.]
MTFMRRILRSSSASSTVDFAFALPVLITIMLGTLQLGQYFQVSGTLRHALGEGIRYAKVYPTATQAQVTDEIRDSMPAVDQGKISAVVFVRGTSGGIDWAAAAIRYRLEPFIPFIPVPPITIQETSVAYIPAGV